MQLHLIGQASLTAAYEVLSDHELKGVYDRGGEEGLKQHEARKAGGGGNPHDLFSRFFGGGHGGGGGEQRGPGLLTNLEVDLADMYAGRTIEVSRSFVRMSFYPYLSVGYDA